MKQNLILFAIALIVGLSACTEDKYMDWKIINDHYYESNKSKPKFTTPSGLQFDTIYSAWNDNLTPNANSKVFVNYTGKLVDGTIFESGENVNFYLQEKVVGLQEGLKKMCIGAHYIFYIPSNLGKGTSTENPRIPANSILIYDVTLLNFYNQ